MTTKTASHILKATHTAGIFADMSVDGPVIGTLVAIVDRAKNLPNRKTIGKQDPYCAMRLGKEAKKTATDIRGGQTPKWDQELRFTVHDGPDYYQLKMSIFTDDKKTDLIGEAWIDLKNIIVVGGGQGDIWQTLTCRGKYAGEIRVEITFYDLRPKPEKPIAKTRHQLVASDLETSSGTGSMKQRTPMKRRPLPSDPVTGETPTTPVHPQSLPPSHAASPVPVLPRGGPAQEQYQTPPRHQGQYPSHPIPTSQSPLPVDYQTPPSTRHQYPDHYSPSHQIHHNPSPRSNLPRYSHQHQLEYDSPSQLEEENHYNTGGSAAYQQSDPRGHIRGENHDMHYREDSWQATPMMQERPPPPPAHRNRNNSIQEVAHRNSFDMTGQKPGQAASMRYDVLKNEAHRHSASTHNGRQSFRGYDSAPNPSGHGGVGEPMRHHSYDSAYDAHYRSMQPTVEDVPDSPNEMCSYSDPYRQNGSRRHHHDDMGYDQDPNVSGSNMSRSPGASHMRGAPNQMPARDGYEANVGSQTAVSPGIGRGFTTSPVPGPYEHPQYSRSSQSIHNASNSPYDHPHHSHSHQSLRHDEWNSYNGGSSSNALVELPLSLVPGQDRRISHLASEQYNSERRQERRYTTQGVGTIRGRHMIEAPPASSHYTTQPHDGRTDTITYSGGPEPRMIRDASPNPHSRSRSPHPHARDPSPNPQHTIRRKSVSPSPHHTIRRKSVSPAPPPVDGRRLSGVPFNPDSYDAYNSGMPANREDQEANDPDAKIITYDGKEIDPSDHLPVESWAPEPEAKKDPSPEPRSRHSLSGAQPMPPSGRKQLRVAVRTQPPRPTGHPSYGPQEPLNALAPVSVGRNRLQKKARPSERHSLPGPTPLTSSSPDKYHDQQMSYSPARARGNSHWEYSSDKYAHKGPGAAMASKLPLPIMSGANGGGNEMALMQEMQRIDIGEGRSRRRGGY